LRSDSRLGCPDFDFDLISILILNLRLNSNLNVDVTFYVGTAAPGCPPGAARLFFFI
jgi:hypothetical protein